MANFKELPHFMNWQAVQPSTGQMVYDEFLDDPGTYAELGTRLSHLQPPEILVSQDASRGLGTMVNEWKRHRYIERVCCVVCVGVWYV